MAAVANVVSIQYGTVILVDQTLADREIVYINVDDSLSEGTEVSLSNGAVMTLSLQPSGTQFKVRGRKRWKFGIEISPNEPPYIPGIETPISIPPSDVPDPIDHTAPPSDVPGGIVDHTAEYATIFQELAELRLELARLHQQQFSLDKAKLHLNRAEILLPRLAPLDAASLIEEAARLRLP